MTTLKLILFVVLLIIAGMVARYRWLDKISNKINLSKLALLISAVYFGFYLLLKFSQYFAFIINAYDFSIFDYALYQAARGQGLQVPFFNGHFFKEHFSPILYLYVPYYAIHASPYNLLIYQALHVSLAAVPLFLIARKIINPAFALLAVFIYLNNWYVVYGLLYDFHVEMLLPLLILTMLWAYLTNRQPIFWTSFILALACKEDVSLYLGAFGLFLLIKDKRRYLGLTVMAIAGLWLLLAFWVMGQVNDHEQWLYSYKFLSRWQHDGQGAGELLLDWLTRPQAWLPKLVSVGVINLLMPLLFLSLVTSWMLPALLPIMINATSSNQLQASFMLYYAAPIIPFLLVAFIFGWKNLMKAKAFTSYCFVLVALLIALNTHQYWPEPVTARQLVRHRMLKNIDLRGEVAAQSGLIPHLPYHAAIKVLTKDNLQPDLVVMDLAGNSFPMTASALKAVYQQYQQDNRYRLILDQDDLKVFRKQGE